MELEKGSYVRCLITPENSAVEDVNGEVPVARIIDVVPFHDSVESYVGIDRQGEYWEGWLKPSSPSPNSRP